MINTNIFQKRFSSNLSSFEIHLNFLNFCLFLHSNVNERVRTRASIDSFLVVLLESLLYLSKIQNFDTYLKTKKFSLFEEYRIFLTTTLSGFEISNAAT